MRKYNKCEGCKLWNGHHCTGARSYEPNSDEHRIICNEHLAKQFWVVYHQLYYSEARVKELEEKLKIAEEVLNDIECQDGSCWCKFCKDRIIKALQKIEEVQNANILS